MSQLCRLCRFSGAAVEKTVVLPQLQPVEKNVAIPFSCVVHMPVVYNDRCTLVQYAETADFPQFQHINKVINIPVVAQRSFPMV